MVRQLRDYGFPDQWGLEKTYQEYLEHLWQMMDECYRVLKPTGTCFTNLGDTYSAANSFGRVDNKYKAMEGSQPKVKRNSGIPDKCLLLIPHRFAIGMIDGVNGHKQWILRNDIIWAKSNSMPESVTDRFSKKHEFFFFFVKQKKYYFDLDGVRESHKMGHWRQINPEKQKYAQSKDYIKLGLMSGKGGENHPSGKNPGDVSDFWNIPTQPSSRKHYATFNTKLIDKPLIAGCPEFVCKKCGKPREKIIDVKRPSTYNSSEQDERNKGRGKMSKHRPLTAIFRDAKNTIRQIKGLTDCNCNAGFEGGLILDPFCGTSTTLIRAEQLNRRWIGIDAKEEYLKISKERLETEYNQLKLDF